MGEANGGGEERPASGAHQPDCYLLILVTFTCQTAI